MNNTATVVGIVLVIVLVVLLIGGAGMMGFAMTLAPHLSAGAGPGMMGGYGGMGGMMRGFGAQGFPYNPVGSILTLAFWALIIAGIVLLVIWLVRNVGRSGLSSPSSNEALEVLKTRYAKGEITKDQYEEMRRVLA